MMNDYKVDTILHLAAQTSVDHSFKSPSVFTDVNVVGTQSLLECSRRATRLRLFLYCSTDEVLEMIFPRSLLKFVLTGLRRNQGRRCD